ncbi:hypothetical protein HHL26_04590 [Sphingobium sp. TB-6]|uniref:hypothetical protein n=1 Tax=Sphingobium sp. TB-6 TaxID=2728850 RepID=UPI00146F8875|nr:hypothetical protein [Sphingobium sp. TB-6]NML88343.1 hypothetical protein [Sphingobium sp. TB-6]
MSTVIRIRAWPRTAATGAAVAIFLAGGNNGAPHYDGNHYRAGIIADPRFEQSISFDDGGWAARSVSQASAIGWQPANPNRLDDLAALYWRDAAIEIDRIKNGVTTRRLSGTIAEATISDGKLVITSADLSNRLDKPFVTATFAGTGGIEGGDAAVGRVKRRSFGRVWNVEGRILDKANNIYEFGDPAFPIQGVSALRDKGRAGPLGILGWQGSIAATLAALQAAEPVRGGGVFAPSIACAKWWTQPSGPLTADLYGEAAGYAETAPGIAAQLLSAAVGPSIANLAEAISLRPGAAGLHIGDNSETTAAALDRLLQRVTMIWSVTATGEIELRSWTFADPVEVLQATFISRERTIQPVYSRQVGYKKNERLHGDGEISIVLQADDVVYADGTSAESLKPAEAGATNGATAEQAAEIEQHRMDIEAAKADIQELIDTYGSTASAAASADAAALARDNADAAAANAVQAASDADEARDAAQVILDDAGTVRDQAVAAKTDAQTAASNASTSATQASASATNAAGSASTAQTQATNAANSATAAGNSATAASTSAGQASTSATNAAGSASAASTSATNAANSATAAGNSAGAASTSASTASTKATEAAQSASAAQTSATTASTKAGEASTSAGQASTSATNAAGSASAASTSATNAANSAGASAGSASAAAGSASTASTKATEAANSATSASTSANTATTKAGDASNSATAAAGSASSAATSSSNAGSSATAAQNSATSAATQAGNAATSATAASGSATTASTQAAAAANSATLAASYRDQAQATINKTWPFSLAPVDRDAYWLDPTMSIGGPGSADWPSPYITQTPANTGPQYSRIFFNKWRSRSEIGRRYRVTGWCFSYATNINSTMIWIVSSSTGAWDGTAVGLGAAVIISQPGSNIGTGWKKYQYEFVVDANWKAYWTPVFEFNTTGASPNGLVHLTPMMVEDITAESGMQSSISTNAIAIATANDAIASLTQQVTAGNPNLCPNGGFENGLSGWSGSGWSWRKNGWGPQVYRDATGGASGTFALTGSKFQVWPSNPFTVTADLVFFATGGVIYVDMLFFDSGGATVLDSGQNPKSPSFDFSDTGLTRQQVKVTAIAPATAVEALVRVVVEGATGLTYAGVRQVKAEKGSIATPFSSEAQLTLTAAAATDAYDKTRAYWQVNAATPGSRAQLTVWADNGGAGVDIVGNVAISGNLVTDGTINGVKLADLAVSTAKLAANAATVPVGTYADGSISCAANAWTSIASLSFSASNFSVLIAASCLIANDTAGGATNVDMRVLRNGTQIFIQDQIRAFDSAGGNRAWTYTIMDSPGSGTVTYDVQIYPRSARNVTRRSLAFIEAKR